MKLNHHFCFNLNFFKFIIFKVNKKNENFRVKKKKKKIYAKINIYCSKDLRDPRVLHQKVAAEKKFDEKKLLQT